MRAIDEIMKNWVLWRQDSGSAGGYGRTFLEKALSGMPTTKCTTCQGFGQVQGARYNLPDLHRVTCLTCQGKGKIIASSSKTKINPAFIRSTRFAEPDDPVSERIDKIVCTMPKLLQSIVYQEYLHPRGGNQVEKAKRVRVGRTRKKLIVGIDRSYFSKKLDEAHKIILNKLE